MIDINSREKREEQYWLMEANRHAAMAQSRVGLKKRNFNYWTLNWTGFTTQSNKLKGT